MFVFHDVSQSAEPLFGLKHIPYLVDRAVPRQYPWLAENQYCDVCIIGGGVTAALCALRIAEQGRGVVVLADREIGFGEDAACPAAVEADFGMTLTDMSRRLDTDTSIRLYALGCAALDELENLCNSLDAAEEQACFRSGFERRDTLLCTDDETELELLRHEYLARRHHQFSCSYITREMARDSFSFDIAGAVLGKGFGAAVNPYALTHLCFRQAERQGAKLFEHTAVTEVELPAGADGSVIVSTAAHRRVYADALIVASGSDALYPLISDIRRRTRYCCVSRPVSSGHVSGWPGVCTIRTFGAPQIGYGFTPDGRIMASGLERRDFGCHLGDKLSAWLPLSDPAQRNFDRLAESTVCLFPDISDSGMAYEYAASYAAAPDGLPVVGTHSRYPGCIFALCTGPATVLWSVVAAGLVADSGDGLHSADRELFAVTRFD